MRSLFAGHRLRLRNIFCCVRGEGENPEEGRFLRYGEDSSSL